MFETSYIQNWAPIYFDNLKIGNIMQFLNNLKSEKIF